MSAFTNYDLWNAILATLTPIVPTYKEYVAQAPLPFARIMETDAVTTHFTRSSGAGLTYVMVEGHFHVYIQSSGLDITRKLADRVSHVLDSFNTTFEYSNGSLMMLEPSSPPVFHPEIQTGIQGTPSVFPATVVIHYCEQRTL